MPHLAVSLEWLVVLPFRRNSSRDLHRITIQRGQAQICTTAKGSARVQQVKPAGLSARDDLNEYPSGEANGWAGETHFSQ